jgi:hypothetical protein
LSSNSTLKFPTIVNIRIQLVEITVADACVFGDDRVSLIQYENRSSIAYSAACEDSAMHICTPFLTCFIPAHSCNIYCHRSLCPNCI